MVEHKGSTSLFAIFALSLYTLVLLPYTIYKFCNSSDEAVVQPYLQGKNKKSAAARILKRVLTKGNLLLLFLWLAWGALLWYVQITSKDLKPFDPFEILGVDPSASTTDIKKAYRQLSLKFHPDKNPDPKAHKYFAESITKAYQALTDEVSRANFEKYGHPDGHQAMDMGVALPTWLFTKDSKLAPIMLLALVGCGILLPLGVVSWFMLVNTKYTGPNGVMQETLFFYLHSKFSIKEAQSLVRIPETLVCAVEFITLPTPAEHGAPLEELRKLVLRSSPELKDKSTFWKRKASVLKAHMLLLAFLERQSDQVSPVLQADLRFVLTKSPLLLEELMKIAVLPRSQLGGWLTPSVAVVEMMQCLAQALSVTARKPGSSAGSKVVDTVAPLLQLPGFDGDVLKKLKKRKISTVKELQDLPAAERQEVLSSCGLSPETVEQVGTLLDTLPAVAAKAECKVEGEDEIMEQDPVRCKVRLLVSRPSHNHPELEFSAQKGKAIRAYTPSNPVPKDENWYVLLCDPSCNAVLTWSRVALAEAEAAGYENPELFEEWERGAADDKAAADKAASQRDASRAKALATANKFISRYNNGARPGQKDVQAADADSAGQLVELAFMAPRAGKHELQLLIMSDSYVGCDKAIPVRIKVAPLSRAIAEGRDAKSLAKAKQWASDDEDEDRPKRRKAKAQNGDAAADAGSDAGTEGDGTGSDEDGDDDINSDEYDSEETGEPETGSDDDSDVGDKIDLTKED